MIKIILLSLVCFIGFSFDAFPQNIDELEKRYDNLRSIVEKDNLVLDSLKNILENRAKQIENEKQKQNSDKDKIIKLMSGSVSLSNAIDEYQEKLESDSKNLKQVSEMLETRYTIKIDSLKLLNKTDKENSEKLDSEILSYTEKRFLISPQIEMLTYNPKKILEIDLTKTKNSDEKASLKEYLSSSLAEVNSVLADVTKQSKETDDALALQKKTSKFLAETEFDRDFRMGKTSTSSSVKTGENALLGADIGLSIVDQINSYALLLDQLNIFDKAESVNSKKFNYKPGSTNLSLKDYSQLLKEVKQKLSDYKLVLTSKIEQSK